MSLRPSDRPIRPITRGRRRSASGLPPSCSLPPPDQCISTTRISGGTTCLVLTGAILLGTPALSGIGAIGAALTLGLRGGGVLLSLLVLPLYIPVLIFGAGAVDATVSGLGGEGHLSLLAAMTFASLGFAPWASAAALKIALE